MAKKRYIDIGHGDRDSILWVWDPRDEKILVSSVLSGTHEKIWTKQAIRMWRGRYDPKTAECSVVVPEQNAKWYEHRPTPSWLVDRLEAQFGSGIKIVSFNPIYGGGEEIV